MGDMDQGIKRLIQAYPRDVLALVLPGATFEGMLTVDVATEPQLVLDTLLRSRYQGVECAVDVEVEASPRPGIGRRLFQYAVRAEVVTGLPVISVVLWLNPNGAPPPSPYELRVGNLLLGTWHFFGIEVYRLPATTLLQSGPVGLLPLVPFMAGGETVSAFEQAATEIKQRSAPDEVQQLEALLAVFASRTIGSEVTKTIIGRLFMSTEILETSPLWREWVARGREEGREEGRRQTIVEVLRSRFGEPSPEIMAALGRVPAGELQEIVVLAATGTLDELRARLGL